MNPPGPIDSLSYLLSHTATILYRQADQALMERLGIGMSQFKILMLLEERSNLQQRQLADSLGQTEASISRQVKLLCEKGMLSATVNPKNRRERMTAPTPKGTKVLHAAEEILEGFYEPAFGNLNDKQRQQFTDMLRVMHGQICQAGKPYACEYGSGIGAAWHGA